MIIKENYIIYIIYIDVYNKLYIKLLQKGS